MLDLLGDWVPVETAQEPRFDLITPLTSSLASELGLKRNLTHQMPNQQAERGLLLLPLLLPFRYTITGSWQASQLVG